MLFAIGIVLRIFCYLGLAFVVSGIAAMMIIGALGVCPRFDTGSISCTTPFYNDLAEYALTVLILTIFTGFPALLAIGGVVFLIYDLIRWRRRRRAA